MPNLDFDIHFFAIYYSIDGYAEYRNRTAYTAGVVYNTLRYCTPSDSLVFTSVGTTTGQGIIRVVVVVLAVAMKRYIRRLTLMLTSICMQRQLVMAAGLVNA